MNHYNLTSKMLYFYYGGDTFSLQEEAAKIKTDFKQKHPQADTVELLVSGEVSDADLLLQVREALEGQGLFSADSLLVIENLISKAKQYPKTTAWLAERTDSADQHLLLIETEKVDKRIREFKIFHKKATSKEFAIPAGRELAKWIKKRLAAEDFQIDQSAVDRFLKLMGEDVEETLHDLWQVEAELSKLMLYKWEEKQIGEADVKALVRPNVSQNVFNLTNLFAERQGAAAARLLEQMVGRGSEADLKSRSIQIIGALASQIRSLLLIKSVSGTKQQIADELNWKPGRVWITQKLAKKFDEEKLKQMLKDLNAIDRRLKTSGESPKLLLELFLQKSNV